MMFYAKDLCIIIGLLMLTSVHGFQGVPSNNLNDLMSISRYLGYLQNTDIVFLVDINKQTEDYLSLFQTLAQESKPCVKKLKHSNNDIALITFTNTSNIVFNFGECKTEKCLMEASANILAKNGSRRLDVPLRQAKKLLKSRKLNIEKQNKSYNKQQAIILLTFGTDVNVTKFYVASRILKNGIDMMVIGLGFEADERREHLKCLVNLTSKQCDSINWKNKSKDIQSMKDPIDTVKTDAHDEMKNAPKRNNGEGYAYVSSLVDYTADMLYLAIGYNCK